MRMVTIAIAASMLLMGVPAYAHEDVPNIEERGVKNQLESYNNSLTVEDDARVQPGWWGDHGVSLNANESGEASVDEQPEWIWVEQTDANVDVTVTTHGALVGAVDVFKYRFPSEDSSSHHTPNCPQQLVEEQYPESLDAPGFLTRVARETVGYHQRAGSSGELPSQADDNHTTSTMDLTLDMSRTEHGYLLAFYPQAATGLEEVEEAGAGEASMWWELAPQQGRMTVQDNLQNDQSSAPVELDEWAGSTSAVLECADRAIIPPEIPEDGAAVPELPGGPDAGEMMDAALPE